MQLIADILSFDHNQEQLEAHFKQASMNWDAIVIIGSKHLMLPALYCRLKAKNLLNLIPGDLNVYLEEIAAINRGRNEVLLAEAHEISELFKKEKIDHVFIKGMALIAGKIYNDPAERMIGDMDILIAPHQLHNAFDILAEHGYNETISFNYDQNNFRHLARQVSKHKFGAIELHEDILIHKHTHHLNNEQLLKRKRIINGIAIPSNDDMVKIAILALQINDKATYLKYINFKTIYDCLVTNIENNHQLLKNLSSEKHSYSFFNLSSVFFKELTPHGSSTFNKCIKDYFILSLHYPILGRFVYGLLNIKLNIQERLGLIVSNKSYRMHIIKNKLLKIDKDQ